MLDPCCYKEFARNDSFSQISDNNEYDHFVITYSKDEGVRYPLYLSEEKRELLDRHGNYDIVDKETGITTSSYKIVYFIPCILKNVGASVALKTTFGLYKLENGNYTEKIDDRKTSKPFLLDKGDKIFVGFYFDLDNDEALGTYKFDLMYSDTGNTRYRRSITFEFRRNPKTKVIEYNRVDTAEHMIFSEKDKKHDVIN